ncbi:MAG: phosphotransferase [Gammaproteobacteria bacterium]|nr:phosphotransferase [Gammaproteobacteria bacterium]
MHIPSALNSVAADPPTLPEAVVADAVAQQYGLRGAWRQLVSERDQNFKLTTADGAHFVVKATSLVQDPVVTDFQIAVLVHLENLRVPGVPRIVRTLSGDEHGEIVLDDGVKICLRIVTFLDGHLLEDCVPSPAIARQLGRRLAELDIALQGFSHAGDSQVLLWDTQRAGELRSLLIHVEDGAMRRHLESVLDVFEERVIPALPGLPRQVIHNDAHNENILIGDDGDIAGIIDFGDMLLAPRIQDVSTAAAYLRADGDDPLQLIAPLVAGYQELNPLQTAELTALFDLVRTRLSMTLILFYWRLSAREKGDPYRQKLIDGERDAYGFLQKLSALGQPAFLARLLQK